MASSSDATPSVRWHTREDSGLRIDRDLNWWHDGERIEHPNIIEAFNRGVRIDPDGRAILVFGSDWCFIEVEDCAYAVTHVDETPAGLSLRLSDRTAELLDPSTLEFGPDGALRSSVKGGQARARFSRPAHFALLERLHDEQGQLRLDHGSGLSTPVKIK